MSDDEKNVALDPEVEKNLPAPLADAIRSGSIDAKIIEHSHDADEAMKAFMSHEGQVITIDEETNRRLLRIIDWHIIPVKLASVPRGGILNADGMLTGDVRCLWLELPRQDNHLVCQRDGHPERYRPYRR